MPTASYKGTIIFTQGKSSWSETIWTTAADILTAQSQILAVARIRSTMLGNPAIVDFIRTTKFGGTRVSRLIGVGGATLYPMPPSAFTSQADRPGAAVLATLYDAPDSLQRSYVLRGCPDDLFDLQSPTNADAAAWFSIFYNQLNVLLTASPGVYQIQARNFPALPSTFTFPTAWVNVAGTLNSIMQTNDILALVPGQRIIVGRNSGIKPAPGSIVVLSVDSTGKILVLKYSLPNNYVFSAAPKVTKYIPVFGTITGMNFDRFTIRRTGRPFGVTPGRQPGVAR